MKAIIFTVCLVICLGFVGIMKILDYFAGLQTPDWLMILGAAFICLGISTLNYPKDRG